MGNEKKLRNLTQSSHQLRNGNSNSSVTAVQFGATGDKAVPADFTGDGRADICIFQT